MNKKVLIISISLLFFVFIIIFNKNYYREADKFDENFDSEITSEIFENEDGFGYRIYIDKNLYIEQPIIPVVSGNRKFTNKSDTQKVIDLVIEKIKLGIDPPTITLEELEKLEVI